jgi:hypothetical protein
MDSSSMSAGTTLTILPSLQQENVQHLVVRLDTFDPASGQTPALLSLMWTPVWILYHRSSCCASLGSN